MPSCVALMCTHGGSSQQAAGRIDQADSGQNGASLLEVTFQRAKESITLIKLVVNSAHPGSTHMCVVKSLSHPAGTHFLSRDSDLIQKRMMIIVPTLGRDPSRRSVWIGTSESLDNGRDAAWG